ncbi:MAG: hypothetical protein KatS3mg109_1097 [Pirellulaceae bacterium]|nr:MAG: hypothetical protein KatS3mg109_1097 [Pirellulaceae bacterium]GIW93660.1 MAG: hypothetical protein KatS3mg110_1701 [Pirellulaceae bacterium]
MKTDKNFHKCSIIGPKPAIETIERDEKLGVLEKIIRVQVNYAT